MLFFDSDALSFKSNVRDRNKNPGGVLHLHRGDASQQLLHYWLSDLANVEQCAAFSLPMGYAKYSFTPYTSKAEWEASYPSDKISGDFPTPTTSRPPPLPPPATPFATPRQPPVPPPPPTTATSADSTVHLGTPPHHTSTPNPTTFNPTTSTAPIATINTSTAPIAATLPLSEQVEQEDARRIVAGSTPADSSSSSARRAQRGTNNETDATDKNKPSNSYPPEHIRWGTLKEAYKTAKFCPHCFVRKENKEKNIRVSRQCRLPGTCFHRSYSYQRRSQSQGHYRRIPYSVPLQEKPYLCRRRGHSIRGGPSCPCPLRSYGLCIHARGAPEDTP